MSEIVPEVLPPEDFNNEVDAVNHFHHCSQASAAQAAAFAVLTGLQLIKIRNSTAQKAGRKKNTATKVAVFQGGWEQWVKDNCTFGLSTAKKYMALAQNIKGRAARNIETKVAGQLEISPSELEESDLNSLLKTISKVTDGNSLSGLYKELGIVKKQAKESLRKGGATHDNGRPSVIPEKLDHEDALEATNELTRSIRAYLNAGYHQHLTKGELNELDQDLIHVRETIKPYMK